MQFPKNVTSQASQKKLITFFCLFTKYLVFYPFLFHISYSTVNFSLHPLLIRPTCNETFFFTLQKNLFLLFKKVPVRRTGAYRHKKALVCFKIFHFIKFTFQNPNRCIWNM